MFIDTSTNEEDNQQDQEEDEEDGLVCDQCEKPITEEEDSSRTCYSCGRYWCLDCAKKKGNGSGECFECQKSKFFKSKLAEWAAMSAVVMIGSAGLASWLFNYTNDYTYYIISGLLVLAVIFELVARHKIKPIEKVGDGTHE